MNAKGPIIVKGCRFRDAQGREVVLRGVNLGGDSKVPYPDGGTHHPSDFGDHRAVSFIGRPFPLAEADAHFARLAGWGFNCLRLLTTWEAVSHAGPGHHDAAYLDYLAAIAERAGAHGLHPFVDFHQDVWSRMSGGDGAPGWTFEAVGLDFTRFHAADAAHVMQAKYDYRLGGRQDAYPQMSWVTNYAMPVNGIMWTLFWLGRCVTPDFRIDGVNVQDHLQGAYLSAVDAVARHLAHLPHVLGFDTLNEPSLGWVGRSLSDRRLVPGDDPADAPFPGPAWSPLDGLAVASGEAVTLPVLGSRRKITGERVLNPNRVSIWRDGASCPFRQAGIWDLGPTGPRALREDAFREIGGRRIDPAADLYGPFFAAVATTIRRHRPDWTLFAEIDAGGAFHGHPLPRDLPAGTAHADHWYDFATLSTKRFDPDHWPDRMTGTKVRGAAPIRASYVRQLARYRARADAVPGGAPCLIGEFGIPFDLNDAEAYGAWARGARDDEPWAKHVLALELMYDALEIVGLHATQWNYTASNRNDLAIGDGWNQEDLSIYSADQAVDGRDGGRAVMGFCRPYARRVQGRLLAQRFEAASATFTLRLVADPSITAPTEIFAPALRYPRGLTITLDGAPAEAVHDPAADLVRVHAGAAGECRVVIRPAKGA